MEPQRDVDSARNKLHSVVIHMTTSYTRKVRLSGKTGTSSGLLLADRFSAGWLAPARTSSKNRLPFVSRDCAHSGLVGGVGGVGVWRDMG